MAKKQKKNNKGGEKTHDYSPPKKTKNVEEKIHVTLEDVRAMSDSDDDEEIPESQWNTKAKNLRQAIQDGKFDDLINKLKKNKEGESDDEIEEATLDDDESSGNDCEPAAEVETEESEEEGVASVEETALDEESESDSNQSDAADGGIDSGRDDKKKIRNGEMEDQFDEDRSGDDIVEGNSKEEHDDDKTEEVDEKDEKTRKLLKNNQSNSKALAVVTAELVASHAGMPWAETFDVIPFSPLPFGEKGDLDRNPLDVHDDLKREVAFYHCALEAVHEAMSRCNEAGIPFSRPDDFFAEMVKTDDHMAKVKDRLIFETKKIEAVAQRKANREHKLRAKESQAHRLAEKAKRKRDHFQQVQEWANSAARNRGGALQDHADDMFMQGQNKKRQAKDRKFGFGGKRGRFKQNDRAALNDVSAFNPRGNFPGMGMKKSSKNKSGAGASRQGKRARDAGKSRRKQP